MHSLLRTPGGSIYLCHILHLFVMHIDLCALSYSNYSCVCSFWLGTSATQILCVDTVDSLIPAQRFD